MNEKTPSIHVMRPESHQSNKHLPVPLVRYSGSFLTLTREKPRQKVKGSWKSMTMRNALHPKDDIDWLFAPIKEEGSGLDEGKTQTNGQGN